MGDYNRNEKKMADLLTSWRALRLHRAKMTGTQSTRKAKDYAIDHFVVTKEHKTLLTKVHADTSMDVSDHWPLLASLHFRIKVPDQQNGEARVVWDLTPKENNPEARPGLISKHAHWNLFAEAFGDEIEDGMSNEEHVTRVVKEYIKSCNDVGEDCGVRSLKVTKHKHPTSSKHARACIERRRLFARFREIRRLGNPVAIAESYAAYKEQRKITKKLAQSVKLERWAAAVKKANKDRTMNPRDFWKWAFSTSGWKRKDSSDVLQPMMNSEGVLQTESNAIREVWRSHYAKLAADPLGHSQDPQHWTQVFPDVEHPKPELSSINDDILEKEVKRTLAKLKNHKAPGPDKIPVEFFKQFKEEEISLAQLTRVLQLIWKHGYVPRELNTANLISIFKKDDPTDPGNYRGISLIDSVIKILITLLTQRLSRELENKKILTRAQCGFRSREESVAQSLALYEIITRRGNVGFPTYTLFLDFMKAYDVVPHQGLFRKLDQIGVRGKMLAFIKDLYRNSYVAVRANDGTVGDAFQLLRGLRQGCPMSPVLFNVFINDIFEHCQKGVRIPSAQVTKNGIVTLHYLQERCPGLLFADDAAAMADSEENLLDSLTKVLTWSERHDMSFGVKKCGLLRFAPPGVGVTGPAFSQPNIWKIGGIDIPKVTEYTYLGLDFHEDVSLEKMATPRINKARKAVFSLQAFFRCKSIPPATKRAILQTTAMQTLLFGSEIWGMRIPRAAEPQKLVNMALRWIHGCKGPRGLMCKAALNGELAMDSVYTMITTRRTRAYLKYGSLNTWIAKLFEQPLRLRKKNWQTITEQWLNRWVKAYVGVQASNAPPDNPFQHNHYDAIQMVIEYTRAAALRTWTFEHPIANQYLSYKFPVAIDFPSWIPYFGNGLNLVRIFRGLGYWTTLALGLASGQEDGPWKRMCPFCRGNTPEDSIHILLLCPAWNDVRERTIGPLIETMERDLGIMDVGSQWRLLLGGEIGGTKLPGWQPNGELEEGEVDTPATFEAPLPPVIEQAHSVWGHCGHYRVAAFLHQVDRKRENKRELQLRLAGLFRSPALLNCQGTDVYD